MLRIIFVALFAVSSFIYTSAQIASSETNPVSINLPEKKETNPVFSVTGSADVYFKNDFAKTKDNNYTSFTGSQNSFSIGMASVKFEHKTDKVGAVLDLGFGPRASEFNYNDNGLLSAVKQMYVSYSAASWLKFTAGTWATHVGYELLDPQLNRNYSMSYLFTNGPFSHTGLKADLSSGKHSFMLGISNATDYRIIPDGQINKKFLLAQYSIALSDNIKLYLNYTGGKAPDTSWSDQIDLVATAKISDKFNLGFNGSIVNSHAWDGIKNLEGKSWGGTALYVNFDPKPWLGLTARTENFIDKNQLKVFGSMLTGGSIFSTTLSANFKTSSFVIIPEFRLDKSNEKIFLTKSGSGKSISGNFLLAAIYSF